MTKELVVAYDTGVGDDTVYCEIEHDHSTGISTVLSFGRVFEPVTPNPPALTTTSPPK